MTDPADALRGRTGAGWAGLVTSFAKKEEAMTDWEWFAGEEGEPIYDLVCGAATREQCIREALRIVEPGERFQIVEARSSTAARYEDDGDVPFVRTRNHEILTAGPHILKEPPHA